MESFTYTISHDLRAPLRALAGFSRMLLEDYGSALGRTGRRVLAKISAAAKKMDALILDLLDYSRVTRQEVKIEAVDLDQLVGDILRQMDPEIRERQAERPRRRPLPVVLGHALTLEPDAHEPPVQRDQVRRARG
jgi:light-regulated signal transduction histidine kinase (bacteriophytochrome)